MQSAAQRDAARSGAGGSGQGERSQPFRADLVHWKWQAKYWRSQHARAKERIAALQAKWKATKQELAEALQKIRGLRQQVGGVGVLNCTLFRHWGTDSSHIDSTSKWVRDPINARNSPKVAYYVH